MGDKCREKIRARADELKTKYAKQGIQVKTILTKQGDLAYIAVPAFNDDEGLARAFGLKSPTDAEIIGFCGNVQTLWKQIKYLYADEENPNQLPTFATLDPQAAALGFKKEGPGYILRKNSLSIPSSNKIMSQKTVRADKFPDPKVRAVKFPDAKAAAAGLKQETDATKFNIQALKTGLDKVERGIGRLSEKIKGEEKDIEVVKQLESDVKGLRTEISAHQATKQAEITRLTQANADKEKTIRNLEADLVKLTTDFQGRAAMAQSYFASRADVVDKQLQAASSQLNNLGGELNRASLYQKTALRAKPAETNPEKS